MISFIPQTDGFLIPYWFLVGVLFSLFWLSLVGIGCGLLRMGLMAFPFAEKGQEKDREKNQEENVEQNLGFSLRLAFALFIGSIFYAVFWSWVPPQWAGLSVVCVGVYLFFRNLAFLNIPTIGENSRSPEKRTVNVAWVLLVGFFFLIRFLPSLKLNTHGDVFGYHLLAPRVWTTLGKIEFQSGLPPLFCASYWEYFLGWAHLFFPAQNVNHWIAAQVFGQWQSFFVAYLGVGLLVWGITGRALPGHCWEGDWTPKINFSEWWQSFAVIAVLSLDTVRDFGTLAKNDWGSLFWGLVIVVLFFQFLEKLPKRPYFFICILGVGLGFAGATKFTLIPSLLAVGVVGVGGLLLREGLVLGISKEQLKWKSKILACLILGGFFGAFPILLRNSFATGNPFFPTLGNLFPSGMLSESYREIMRPVESSDWRVALSSLQNSVFEQGLIFFVALATGILAFFKRWKGIFIPLFVSGVLGMVFYVFKGVYEIRYTALSLILIVWAGVVFLGNCLKDGDISWPVQPLSREFLLRFIGRFIFTVVLVDSGLPLHLLPKVVSGNWPSADIVVNHEILSASILKWARKNIPAGTKVLSSHIELYYVSHLKTSQPQLDPKIDIMLRDSSDGSRDLIILENLVDEGFEYYLDMKFQYGSDFTFLPLVERVLKTIRRKNQTSDFTLGGIISFEDSVSKSRVIDLKKLLIQAQK